jgi:hypothetical protein
MALHAAMNGQSPLMAHTSPSFCVATLESGGGEDVEQKDDRGSAIIFYIFGLLGRLWRYTACT